MQPESASTPKGFFCLMKVNLENRDYHSLSQTIKQLYHPDTQPASLTLWSAKFNVSGLYDQLGFSRTMSRMLEGMQQYQCIRLRENVQAAYKFHLETVLVQVLKIFEELKDASLEDLWICKLLRFVVRSTKAVFLQAHKYTQNHGHQTLKIDDLINTLQRYKSSRALTPEVKAEILPLIDIMQVSILLRFHNYEQINRIINSRKVDDMDVQFLNNFLFQKGKVALINERMKQAEQNLQNIKVQSSGQKKLVLRYLIPCKIFLGKMFKAEHSDEVFPEYQPIIESIIEANFAKYDEHFEKYQRLWIKRGIYLLMDKLRVLIWRNLLKKISQVQDKQPFKINIDHVEKGVRIKGGKQKLPECICIISNLIYEGYVKGYIFQNEEHRFLVLSKKNPFPSLSSIYE